MNLFQMATRGVNLDALPDEDAPRSLIDFGPAPVASGRGAMPEQWNDLFDAAASEYGVDPTILKGIAYAESRFRPDVIDGTTKSSAGALGMMQFMPATAKEMGINPLDPVEAVFGAAQYLRQSLDKFDGDTERAIASYNWGRNRTAFDREDWYKSLPAETRNYVGTVLEFADGVDAGKPQASARQELPEGVKPSQAGAGRGQINPTAQDTAAAAAALEPPKKGVLQRVGDELGQLRDEFFSGVTSASANLQAVNTSAAANQLLQRQEMLAKLEREGKGESAEALGLRKYIQHATARLGGMAADAADAGSLADAAGRMTNRPAVEAVTNAKTFDEAWAAFKKNPYDVIAGVTAQSSAQMIPMIVAAALGGPALGAGVAGGTSALSEFGSGIREFARDNGIDPSDKEALTKLLSDPDVLRAATSYAGKGGLIVGALDAASGGVAGKTLAPMAIKNQLVRQAVNLPVQAGVQGAMGGAGEAGKQLAQKGEIDQPGQVLAEVVGEFGGAPVEVLSLSGEARQALLRRNQAAPRVQDQPTVPTVPQAVPSAKPDGGTSEAAPGAQTPAAAAAEQIAPQAPATPAADQGAAAQAVDNIDALLNPAAQPAAAPAPPATETSTATVEQAEQQLAAREAPAQAAPVDMQLRPTGTLLVKGDVPALRERLASAGVDNVITVDGGLLVARSQAEQAQQALSAPSTAATPQEAAHVTQGQAPQSQPAAPASRTAAANVARTDAPVPPAGVPAAGAAAPSAQADGVRMWRESAQASQVPVKQEARASAGAAPVQAPAVKETLTAQQTASWVIRNKETGQAVMETRDPKKVAALNTRKYEAIPVREHLASLSGSQQAQPAQQQQAKAPDDAAAQQRKDFAEAEKRRTAPGNRARARSYDANPFRAFLGKHGVATDVRTEFAPGVAEQRGAMVPGYGPIFRKKGKQLDALAQAAVEEGFLIEPDVAALHELIGRAMRGQRVIAQYAQGVAESEMEARIARQREMEEDAAFSALQDSTAFEIDDADIPWDAPVSNMSTEAAMRDLGFTEEEIQDAIAQESRGTQEDGPSRGAPDEHSARAPQEGVDRGNAPPGPTVAPRHEGVAQAPGDLLGDSPNTSQQTAADERARRAQQEQQRRNAAPGPEGFSLGMEDARTGWEVDPGQGDLLMFSRARGTTASVATGQDVVGDTSGNPADDITSGAAIDEDTGLPLNADGTVTVYHHTNASAAEAIRRTGTLKAKAEPDVYVTTHRETDTGYGDTAVPIRVKPEALLLDDEFPNGRKDFRLPVGRPGGFIKVTVANESSASAGSDAKRFSRTQSTDQTQTEAFKRWFGDSKVVDPEGKPLVVYHGTVADFDAFDNAKTGANDRGLWGRGHYFSASVDNANSYALRQGDGARLIPAYVSIKNPLILKTGGDFVTRLPDGTNTRELVGPNLDGAKIKQIALDGGHDGVIQIRPNGLIGDIVAFRPEQIKSATGNNGQFDPANPDIRYSFAGQNASTADKLSLASAQQRIEAGEDAEAVRRATGWHRGADSKWRFEISDAKAFLKGTGTFEEVVMRRMGALERDGYRLPGDPVRLEDVMRHEALFAAYPSLRSIEIEFLPQGDSSKGRLVQSGASTAIQVRADLSGAEALSVLLHEVQHGIQDIEGFATGDSPDRLARTMPDEKAINDAKLLARFMARGESAFEARQTFRRYLKRDPSAEGAYMAERYEPEEIARMATGPMDAYKRSAGEVEARNTQSRQSMTDEQRRATPPSSTADIADADVIVTFNGKEMAHAPQPANASREMPVELAQALMSLRAPIRATKESVQAALDQLVPTGGRLPNGLGRIVVANASEIAPTWEPLIGQVDIASEDAGRAQGFYDPRTKTVFLIADHIRAGDEIAVAAHELMHKHGQAVLGAEGWNRLHSTIEQWADAPEGSTERQVYDEAVARVEASRPGDISIPEYTTQELFPYAVQVALEMGVQPSALKPISTVAGWLAHVRGALRRVWNKIANPKGDFNSLDLVNLAFGIAQRENPAHRGELDGISRARAEEAAAALQEISEAGDLFALPKSSEKTVEAIAADHDPEIVVRRADLQDGETMHTLTMPDNTTATITTRELTRDAVYGMNEATGQWITERPGENAPPVGSKADVWVDVSRLQPGRWGGVVYNIAATYAHNTGRIFIGDPSGLSDVAMRRRAEQMLGSALKFGTTDHLAPHPRQVAGDAGLGVPPLRWVYGDHEGNIGRLVDVNQRALENAYPEAKNLRYDPDTGNFIDSRTGEILTREQMAQAVAQGRGPVEREAGAGWRTVARGAVFRALLGGGAAARQGKGASQRAEPGPGRSAVLDAAGRGPDQSGAPRDTDIERRGGALAGLAEQRERLSSEDRSQRIFYSRSADPVTPATDKPALQWRDASGQVQFAPGDWLYRKLGDVAAPMLTALGLKAASPELRRQLRMMKLQVQRAQELSAKVATEAAKLSATDRAMVSDLVEKDMQAGTIPPEHAVKLAAIISNTMAQQSKELVELGMLSKESAERWEGVYLPRFYESKLSKKVGDAWADAMRRMVGRPRPMKGIGGKHLKGRGIFETIDPASLENYQALGWEVRDPDYQPGTSTQVQVWRDFNREERAKMGEIRDAGFRFVMGYMQTQKDIALGRMFQSLANDERFSSRLPTKEMTVRVPDSKVEGTGAHTYGKLAGRYVSKETLSHLSSFDEVHNDTLQMYRQAMSLWKEGKTVLNPVAHMNNVVSNLTMAHLAGISYYRGDKYLGALADFIKGSPMIEDAKDAGLFLGSFNQAELMDQMPDELKKLVNLQESTGAKTTKTAMAVMTWALRKPMGKAYEFEDSFFKYMLYKDARQRGLEQQDAIDYAQRYIFTYDDLPKGARRIRDFGIPFFAYTYKAVPALLHTAMAHPVRMATPAALLWATTALTYAAMADGDDDTPWDELAKKYLTDADFRKKAAEAREFDQQHMPTWMRGSTAFFTPKTMRVGYDKVMDLPVFLDISRFIPGGDLFDVTPNAGGLPLPQPITPNHPLLTMAMGMLGNKDLFSGKELVDKNDTKGEAVEKRLLWIYRQVAPAVAVGQYHWNRGMEMVAQASGGEITWMPDVVAEKYTGIGSDGLPVLPQYGIPQTFGIKIRPMDQDKAEDIERAIDKKLIQSIDADIRALVRQNRNGTLSDKAFEKQRDYQRMKQERLRDGLTVDGDAKE